MAAHRRWLYTKPPGADTVTADNYTLEDGPMPVIGDGQALVKALFWRWARGRGVGCARCADARQKVLREGIGRRCASSAAGATAGSACMCRPRALRSV